MKTYFNSEVVQVEFNNKTFKWSFDIILNNSGNSINIQCTEMEAQSILDSFTNVKISFIQALKRTYYLIEIPENKQ